MNLTAKIIPFTGIFQETAGLIFNPRTYYIDKIVTDALTP
jgi:hypothetical protein